MVIGANQKNKHKNGFRKKNGLHVRTLMEVFFSWVGSSKWKNELVVEPILQEKTNH